MPTFRRQGGERAPVQEHLPFGPPRRSAGAAAEGQQARLAAAAGSHDGGDLAGGDDQVQWRHQPPAAERQGDPVQDEGAGAGAGA